jgi:hypothetical protein
MVAECINPHDTARSACSNERASKENCCERSDKISQGQGPQFA